MFFGYFKYFGHTNINFFFFFLQNKFQLYRVTGPIPAAVCFACMFSYKFLHQHNKRKPLHKNGQSSVFMRVGNIFNFYGFEGLLLKLAAPEVILRTA